MKIVSVKAHVLRHKLDQKFLSSFSTFEDRWSCLVEITCNDGTVGWGECLGPARPNAAIIAAMEPHLIGQSPLQIEPLWAHLYNQFRDQGQRGLTMTALSGIDIALWDIAGKHFGVPIHVLLGGAFRLEVPAYATGGFPIVGTDRIASLREEVTCYREAGFGATKIKIGFGLKQDLAAISAARDAIGPDIQLMIDANHGYDAIDAIRLGRAAAEFDIDWFEEPVVPEQLARYRDVREGQPIPVAGGETWHGRAAFTAAIDARAIDILQPDVCGCGGITEMRKIIAAAETAGIRVVPHVWGTAIAVAASLHMLATLPPSPLRHDPRQPMLEFDQTHNPFRMAIVETPITATEGVVAVPDGPGLGLEIVPAQINAFRDRG